MHALIRCFVLAVAGLVMTVGTADAQSRHYGRSAPYYHHHGWDGARFWGGVGIGFGLGTLYYGAPWYPGYVAVPAYPAYPVYPAYPAAPSEPIAKMPPDPVIYPRNGQSAAQLESDRQDCNRWAMTQPSAVADASVFHRATIACMEGRGYTVR